MVIANLKTLTTAGFSSIMLGRSYSWARWRALILLVCGVVLFILPTLESSGRAPAVGGSAAAAAAVDVMGDKGGAASAARDLYLGIAAEIIVVSLSGFASIYFESAIKRDPYDIWERNFQLGFYSILMTA